METYGTYNGIKFLMDGSMELSFLVPHHEKSRLLASIDEITQAGLPTLEITAKKKRKKRSLDANDYLWVLCTKIAERLQDSKLSISKEEVHRKHIRNRVVNIRLHLLWLPPYCLIKAAVKYKAISLHLRHLPYLQTAQAAHSPGTAA